MRALRIFALAALVAAPASADDFGGEHAMNGVLRAALEEGLTVGGVSERLPRPALVDGMSADDQRAALKKIAGSDRAAVEMTADSVTAPHILRTRDIKAGGATLRALDLYFVIRADLDAIRPDRAFAQFEGAPVEAGNMRFEARVLTADDLKGAGVPAPGAGGSEWFAHSSGRLLDRIAVEATARVVATKGADSSVFASATDPRFGAEGRWPNRWSTIVRKGAAESLGPAQPFAGSVGYVKISRLAAVPGAALVESHFVFAEPDAWFDGAPILRSKFGLIAQDQVRRLRRDLREARR